MLAYEIFPSMESKLVTALSIYLFCSYISLAPPKNISTQKLGKAKSFFNQLLADNLLTEQRERLAVIISTMR